MISPPDVTSSRPQTAVARLPFVSPEPCVAVATAPATQMWGSDARLCKATPSAFNFSASSPYLRPALKETVFAAWSTTMSMGMASSVISSRESAMPLKEWREPRTRTPGALAIISCTCSIVDGRCSFCAPYVYLLLYTRGVSSSSPPLRGGIVMDGDGKEDLPEVM